MDNTPVEYSHPTVIAVTVDEGWGHICVEHTGDVSWETLQDIKNNVWGENTVAVEIFPKGDMVVNSGNWRHLWKLSPHDLEIPNLLEDHDHKLAEFERLGPIDDRHRLVGENVHSEWMTRADRDMIMRFRHLGWIEIDSEGTILLTNP